MTEREWEILEYVREGMRSRHKNYRDGQCLFNALYLVKPNLADEIRGSPMDPFYQDNRINLLLDWLQSKSEGGKHV